MGLMGLQRHARPLVCLQDLPLSRTLRAMMLLSRAKNVSARSRQQTLQLEVPCSQRPAQKGHVKERHPWARSQAGPFQKKTVAKAYGREK